MIFINIITLREKTLNIDNLLNKIYVKLTMRKANTLLNTNILVITVLVNRR